MENNGIGLAILPLIYYNELNEVKRWQRKEGQDDAIQG